MKARSLFSNLWFAAVIAVMVQLAYAAQPEGPPPESPQHFKTLTATQKQVFETCLSDKGIPLPPKPSEMASAVKVAFDECRGQVTKGDHEAFDDCLFEKGISPPPKPNPKDRESFHACLDQALGN